MFYSIRDFATAKILSDFQGLIQLQTPAMIGGRLVINGSIYEIKEMAHDLELSGVQKSHTRLFVTKIA